MTRAPRARRRRLVTLSSDVGPAYAAQMKAVLASGLAPGRVVDLSHDLRPHDVRDAGFVVRAMGERFPAGTVHVVVVDPGVGGARQPVVIACADGSQLVGPDNGVLAPLAAALGGGIAYRIEPARLGARPRVGTTFDGRDIFAPAAALLAEGVPARRLGPRTTFLRPAGRPLSRSPRGAVGTVAHVDRFGNLVTDIPTDWLPATAAVVTVRWGRTVRHLPFVRSYEQGGRGRLFVLGSSFGTLELAVGEGRAADRLPASAGTPVRLSWPPRPVP